MKATYHTPLSRLLALRLFMCALCVIGLLVAGFVHYPLPWLPMSIIVAINAASVIPYAWRLSRGWSPSEPDMTLQLAQDNLALLLLLYFSGGTSNPFISLLLLPIAVASSLLTHRWVWLLALEACAGYCFLLIEHWPLPPLASTLDIFFWQFQMGMAANFLLTAALLCSFVTWLTQHLRAREAEITRLRETAQRQEQLLGVATFAAGAAHELGTPLNTLNLLVDERLADSPGIEARADLLLMQQQVQHCRSVLLRLSQAARERDDEPVNLKTTLQQLFDHWLAMRPQIHATIVWPDQEAPAVCWSPLLDQALLNLCNNAADVSPEAIQIEINWDSKFTLTIDDTGPGPSPAMLAATPSPVKSGKTHGLGLGVWLSNASLELFQGQVCYIPRQPQGTRTIVEIPLAALQ